MSDEDISGELGNSCTMAKEQCLNCHKHFMTIRPLIKNVVVTKRFFKDFGDTEEAKAYISQILACSNVDFHEMHKYEQNVDGNLIFRAKKEGMHMVYAFDRGLRLVFLRAFRNFSEYGKFLEDRQEIKRALSKA